MTDDASNSAAGQSNSQLWNRLYETGSYLRYPYDAAVRIVHRHLAAQGFSGTILDHGCGSGNHLEFFVRLGLRSIGTEVAASAAEIVRTRFRGAMLPCPPVQLIDLARPLAPQLPAFDHAFVWASVHYNRRARVLEDIAALIGGLPKGGAFILSTPSSNDVAYSHSEALADGSRRFTSDVSGQLGAFVTIPESQADLIAWCRGIEVRDCGNFGWTIGGRRSELYFLYGVKS